MAEWRPHGDGMRLRLTEQEREDLLERLFLVPFERAETHERTHDPIRFLELVEWVEAQMNEAAGWQR